MIILDTNVISELMKPHPAPQVAAWMAQQSGDELFTTTITEAEIFYGLELLTPGKRHDALVSAAEAVFTQDLGGRVLGFESDAARIFSKMAAQRRALGRPISHADAQIASITRARRAKLATRNKPDFADCGIDVIDPWSEV